MATMPCCHHHACQWDAPPAPPTRPVNQAQGIWHRAQAHDINCLPLPRRNQPTAMTPCRHHHNHHWGHLGHTTPPPSARNSPSVAQKSAVPTSWGRATTYQRQPRRHNATMAKAIGAHPTHPPCPPSTRPKGPGAAHKRAVPIAQCPTTCAATTNAHHSMQPPTPTTARNHQCPPQHATTTTIRGSQHHPP